MYYFGARPICVMGGQTDEKQSCKVVGGVLGPFKANKRVRERKHFVRQLKDEKEWTNVPQVRIKHLVFVQRAPIFLSY